MRAKSARGDAIPEFGLRVSGVAYRDRSGAYAVILGSENRFAFVRGGAGRLFLPGGGMRPDECPEDALMRGLSRRSGGASTSSTPSGAPLSSNLPRARAISPFRATYFRAALSEGQTTKCEHELILLSAADAASCLARESDERAISEVCKSL
jgi:hypothetical protein